MWIQFALMQHANKKPGTPAWPGPMVPRLDDKRQSCCRRSGRIGRHLSGGISLVISAARDATENESTASKVSPSSLYKNLTPEIELLILPADLNLCVKYISQSST